MTVSATTLTGMRRGRTVVQRDEASFEACTDNCYEIYRGDHSIDQYLVCYDECVDDEGSCDADDLGDKV